MAVWLAVHASQNDNTATAHFITLSTAWTFLSMVAGAFIWSNTVTMHTARRAYGCEVK